MTKIFLTGATGFVGGAVLERLLNKDYQVTALVRDAGKGKKLESLGVKALIGDLDSKQVLVQESFNADVVIHTAHADHLLSVHSIVEGLYKKLKETGKKGVLIHTSGTGILTDNAMGQFASEKIYDDANTSDLDAIPLRASHRDVDTFLFEASKNYSQFDLVIVAPSNIYGHSSGNGGISNIISSQIPNAVKAALRKKQPQVIGKGLNIWGNVHISDLADFYFLILQKLIKGELKLNSDDQGYYLVENGHHEWKAIHEEIAKILVKKGITKDSSVKFVNTDEEILDAYGNFSCKYGLATNSRPKASKARRIGWNPKHADVFSTIEADVDYQLARQ